MLTLSHTSVLLLFTEDGCEHIATSQNCISSFPKQDTVPEPKKKLANVMTQAEHRLTCRYKGGPNSVSNLVRTRSAPLRVGRVGKGAQTCSTDVMLPLAIPRTSDGAQGGTLSALCIDGSSAPANEDTSLVIAHIFFCPTPHWLSSGRSTRSVACRKEHRGELMHIP